VETGRKKKEEVKKEKPEFPYNVGSHEKKKKERGEKGSGKQAPRKRRCKSSFFDPELRR